ncbi:MAG: OmpA family protein [Bacteroidales bacterium]|nr:OmpA family protein [Bacteroidales bacterium]
MKGLSWLFFFLLLIWIVIASYLYVCKIRGHCGKNDQVAQTEVADAIKEEAGLEDLTQQNITDSVALALDYLDKAGIKTFYFDFASAELAAGSDDDEYFSALRTYLRHHPDEIMTVRGHADNRGSSQANDRFGRLRAEAVRDHCIMKGIGENQIRTESKGTTEPAASNDSAEGRKLNRRAEIILN